MARTPSGIPERYLTAAPVRSNAQDVKLELDAKTWGLIRLAQLLQRRYRRMVERSFVMMMVDLHRLRPQIIGDTLATQPLRVFP